MEWIVTLLWTHCLVETFKSVTVIHVTSLLVWMMESVQAVEEHFNLSVDLVLEGSHVPMVCRWVLSKCVDTLISSNNPNFNGDSYISYPSINESLETVLSRSDILRTETKLSLILCNGQISGTDYILLNLSSNFVQFRYDWGSEPVVMENRWMAYNCSIENWMNCCYMYTDNKWYW